MDNFYNRIEVLSPYRLKLLRLRLEREGIAAPLDLKGLGASVYSSVGPVEEREYYPLSSAQKRLFALGQLEGADTVYHLPMRKKLAGKPDKQRLEWAFRTLVKRHESLRTSFDIVFGEPVQRVHRDVDLVVRYLDCARDCADDERALEGILGEFIKPFDLKRAPLLRVAVVVVPGSGYLLLTDMHHIIADALSKRILWEEFDRLYRGEELAGAPVQYKDFACWCESGPVRAMLERQGDYWMREFSGHLPEAALPIDHARPENRSYEGGYAIFFLDQGQTAALKALAARGSTSLFVVMLALYNVLLAKLSGQKDIVVGIPVAGRRHPGLAGTIGMFVNTLALRNHPEDEKTFDELLKDVRQRTLAAFENQDYPFESLVNRVVKKRTPGRNPLFDVFFAFRTAGAGQGAGQGMDGGMDLEDMGRDGDSGSCLSMFDLFLYGGEVKGEIRMGFIYALKIFKNETIHRFITYFREIIGAVIAAVAENREIKPGDIAISHQLATARSRILEEDDDEFGF